MKKAIALILALVFVFSFAACGDKGPEGYSAENPLTIKLADNQADGTPNVAGDREFARLVEEYTEGAVIVEVHNNAVLGDEASVADQLQAGTLDMARISTNGISPSCTAFNVFGLPYVFPSDQAKYDALDGEFGQKLTEVLKEETGMVNLTYFVSGARSFYTTKVPVYGVADMAGLKLRAQDDAVTIAMIDALGGAATPMNYSEVYSALETSIIDGAENDFVSYYTSGHYEVAPYYSLDMHTCPSSLLVMSGACWEKLGADLQEKVMKAAADASAFQRTTVEQANADARAAVEAAGCTIIEVDVAEFQDVCAAVHELYPDLVPYVEMIG